MLMMVPNDRMFSHMTAKRVKCVVLVVRRIHRLADQIRAYLVANRQKGMDEMRITFKRLGR